MKTDTEVLTAMQRWAGLFIIVGMFLLGGYFVYHQLTNTGFFTDKFRSLEMLCLYGPILVSWIAPLVRAFNGHRNPARPFEAATSLTLAMGSLWLWIIFPFNFAHLADILPGALRFVISWITNDTGKVLLMLQVIIGPIAALWTILKYFSVRRQARSMGYIERNRL